MEHTASWRKKCVNLEAVGRREVAQGKTNETIPVGPQASVSTPRASRSISSWKKGRMARVPSPPVLDGSKRTANLEAGSTADLASPSVCATEVQH